MTTKLIHDKWVGVRTGRNLIQAEGWTSVKALRWLVVVLRDHRNSMWQGSREKWGWRGRSGPDDLIWLAVEVCLDFSWRYLLVYPDICSCIGDFFSSLLRLYHISCQLSTQISVCADWTVEERKKGKASEDIGIVVEHDPVSGLGNVQGSFWQWGKWGGGYGREY